MFNIQLPPSARLKYYQTYETQHNPVKRCISLHECPLDPGVLRVVLFYIMFPHLVPQWRQKYFLGMFTRDYMIEHGSFSIQVERYYPENGTGDVMRRFLA